MCELCSNNKDELEKARKEHLRFAEKLEKAALINRQLAAGVLKPHSKEFINETGIFKSIIRTLVQDYV